MIISACKIKNKLNVYFAYTQRTYLGTYVTYVIDFFLEW